MKYLLGLFLFVCLVSCDQKQAVDSVVYIGNGISIAVIDSCEYLYRQDRFLSHKGNCRFCKERSERNNR